MRIISRKKRAMIAITLALGLGAAMAGAALAYNAGPALRQDYQGSMAEPGPEQGAEYKSSPALRMDFQGRMALPAADSQGPAYKPAPAKRIDFQGSRRPDGGR